MSAETGQIMPPVRLKDLARHRVAPGYRPGWFALLWMLAWFRWPPHPAYGWRAMLLRAFGATIGKGVKVRNSARIFYSWRLSIGDHSWVDDFADLCSHAQITIGRDSVISQHGYICTAGHDYSRPEFSLVFEPAAIGDEVWIAAGVHFTRGVTIGMTQLSARNRAS